jgi:hypothetical protein
MRTRPTFLFLLLILCFGVLIFTEDGFARKSDNSKKRKTEKSAYQMKFLPLPVLFYRPETSMAFGAQIKTIFRTGKKQESARPSTIVPEVIYTLNKQFISKLASEIYLDKDQWRLKSYLDFRKFPDLFFGIGNLTDPESEETFTSRSWEIILGIERHIGSGFHVGAHYHFNHWSLKETESGKLLDSDTIPGSEGGNVSGAGIRLVYDTRDHIFYPRKGEWFSLIFTDYRDFLGSCFNYSDFTMDLRKYLAIARSQVMVFQLLLKSQSGTVPFPLLAMLGGSHLLRGYYTGRFRDKNLLVLQAEWRCPLFWRIGLSVFAGMGQVADRFSHLNAGNFHYSTGLGLRLLYNRKESIHARMDFALGKDSSGIYMEGDESF